ncbi:peptidase t [Anaeramoeba flamelloides]|uniref:Peptidase t n=1 Tax=Anaeramoeba flamelloides TaxID=1746091 RepID=A0ABQ8ZFH1_9EUKA|nr:peptidase t [Anaeramoeba flamelloides]
MKRLVGKNSDYTVTKRFLKYVQINTQSSSKSKTVPSTERQKQLSEILKTELEELGLDPTVDKVGNVYCKLPSNLEENQTTIPVIALLAHLDTSEDAPSVNVKPIIHENYSGDKIALPKGNVILDPNEITELKELVGQDIITSSGDTLLGADDKSGIASIMDALTFFVQHPEIKHGEIQVCFSIDEEIGTGPKTISLEKLGNPKFGYTVDGGSIGRVESCNFNADKVYITFEGFGIHPGRAKNRMVNAIKLAGEFLDLLPKDTMSPETTEKMEGYVHPFEFQGNVNKAEITFLIRDFELGEMKKKEKIIQELGNKVVENKKNCKFEMKIVEQYRNMIDIISQYPFLLDFAEKAIEKTQTKVIRNPIRGGSDGSYLSYNGLPTPNLSAGGYCFHSIKEFTTIQHLQKIVDMLIELIITWVEEYPKIELKSEKKN